MLKLSYLSSGDCSPMQAVIGSITAQEVMKVRREGQTRLYNNSFLVRLVVGSLVHLFNGSILMH